MPNATFLHRAAHLFFYGLLPFFAIGQADTVPPQLVCKNYLEVSMPSCGFYGFNLQPADLLENYSDNATPAAQLVLKARRACTGTGFPQDLPAAQLQPLYFAYYDLNCYFPTEIWARDAAGNMATCSTNIFFFDGSASCDPGMHNLAVYAGNGQAMPGVEININGHRCPGDTLIIQGTTFWSSIGQTIPSGFQATVTATKNTHPLNGITMHDLFLISQHIQGITPLTNPYQLIAADANQDGQITDNDRLILRRLMNGTISELPNGRSWRFVPADFVFDPLQPLVFPEKFEVSGTDNPSQSFHFKGVKIGDVDFSADPNQ
ncbi:MAG: dockerin type I domain-containing protein [Saprospiraceae bacterium]